MMRPIKKNVHIKKKAQGSTSMLRALNAIITIHIVWTQFYIDHLWAGHNHFPGGLLFYVFHVNVCLL